MELTFVHDKEVRLSLVIDLPHPTEEKARTGVLGGRGTN